MSKRESSVRVWEKQTRPVPRDIAESLGKLPPSAPDLEEVILGAIMIQKGALDEVAILKSEHFYAEKHQVIFESILSLSRKNEPYDLRLVVSELRKMGKLELVGGASYIAELTSNVSSAGNIAYHARIIYEMFIKRELIQIASTVHSEAYEDTTDVFELHEKASNLLFELVNFNQETVESLMQIAKREIPELGERMRKEGLTGVPTGFKKLNQILGGWQTPDLIVIGARPSMGKTAFMNSLAIGAARNKFPVAIFSLEMSKHQLYNRFVGVENEIEVSRLQSAKISETEYASIIQDLNELHSLPIYIDDTPSLAILELRAKCRRLKTQFGIQLIMVDYLQLMKGDGYNREQEIASISRALKVIAKDLKVPVIAFSQLSRDVEKRSDKRPQLADLRESGATEQDADIVGFLFRPEYYKIPTIDLGHGEEINSEGICEVIIAKNRNGSLATIPLKFIGRFTKFMDYERPSSEPGKKEEPKVSSNQDEQPPF